MSRVSSSHRRCCSKAKNGVCTMCTPWASDWVLHRSDWLGFPYVFGTSQCLQGLECGSSPTSGTADPLVSGVFALTCG